MNTAIIGCGYWGPNILRNLDLISTVKVVVDIDEQVLNNHRLKYPHIYFTNNIDDIYNFDVESIAIVTPPSTHYTLAKKFNNYNLFIEKPLAHNLIDAKQLLDIENKNKVNCVGHVFLFSPEIKRLKQLINNKDIYNISITRMNFGKYQICGVEADLLPHDLSILLYLLEKDLKAKTACYSKVGNINVSGCAIVGINNIDCTIISSWTNTNKIRTIIVDTNDGVFEYDMSIPNIIKHYNGRILEKNMVGKLENIEVEFSDEPLLAELKYWLNLINNPNNENIISFSDGYKVVKLIDDIKKISYEDSI